MEALASPRKSLTLNLGAPALPASIFLDLNTATTRACCHNTAKVPLAVSERSATT
jgi:hypothetical protein